MFEPYSLTKTIAMKNDMLCSQYYTQPELELTLNQKRLLMLLVSRINKDDQSFRYEEVSLRDYCDLFGIVYDGGSNKKEIRKSLLDIAKKVFILPLDEKGRREQLFRWVDDMKIDYTKGVISIKLSECLRPYYIELKNNFMVYQLGYTTSFQSKYSYTLYELCKSKAGLKTFYLPIGEALLKIAYNKYTVYADFMRRVVKPAIEEINKYTDTKVTCKPQKTGNRVTALMFHVTKKVGAELAAADKWKAGTNKKLRQKNIMDTAFAYQIADAEDMEDYAEVAEEQYDRLMAKYAEEAAQKEYFDSVRKK